LVDTWKAKTLQVTVNKKGDILLKELLQKITNFEASLSNSVSYVSKSTVRGARPKISKQHATFRFKMETPRGEKITESEFRIYKEPTFNTQKKISWENSTYIIRLFQVCIIFYFFL